MIDYDRLKFENKVLKHGFDVIIRLLIEGVHQDDILDLARKYSELRIDHLEAKSEGVTKTPSPKFIDKIERRTTQERSRAIRETKTSVMNRLNRLGPGEYKKQDLIPDGTKWNDFWRAMTELRAENKIIANGMSYRLR